MAGDLVPERRDQRASHEDRDAIADQLRVAAGDGRLSPEELDERLEIALTARTYGELEQVVQDLPVASEAKEAGSLQTKSGSIRRDGAWKVPRRLTVSVSSGSITLDFTQAVIVQPVLDLDVTVGSGNVTIIVAPGIDADVDHVQVGMGSAKRKIPVTGMHPRLRIAVSGRVKSGNLVIRPPRRSFWGWLRRGPYPGF